MINNILKQLEIIDKSITWLKSSTDFNSIKARATYANLVNCRRKLNKKKFALEGNPAAAMYGESQAGKSYLVSSLLSENGKSFKILDGKGNEYDFKQQINPRGNEMESTSVVTRFSTKYKIINSDYQIIAKLLSPTDIILVLCEAYYNNLQSSRSIKYEELKEKIDFLESNYASKYICQNWISEDNVLDIRDYFVQYFSNIAYNNIADSFFFEKISSIVTKIAPEEWKNVFSLLWNFNQQLTKLFDDLITKYININFADTVYLPIDAVLREKGTLLDVSRLDEIYDDTFNGHEANYCAETSILYDNDKISQIPKSYLCALIAELIFVLPEKIKEEKPFLDKTDLLDFPGTRRFESTEEDNISDKSLTVLLRRGRVDYLFNKYSEAERINALLFCQNHKQSNQSVMPAKLNHWIGNMIGKTPDEREFFKSPVPPLFVISTWFNKDLEFDNHDKNSLIERWVQRFTKTLEREIFKVDTYSWLIDWTKSKPNFQNIYLLRDFEKSADEGQNCSRLYRGYIENNYESEEIMPASYPDFRKDLRQSFLDYDFVKSHFADPTKSWDEAASINKDGTKLIIDNLTIAADNINPARITKMLVKLNEISETILCELLKHFHSNNKDEELQKAKNLAGDIQFKLDTAFSADNIKNYGQLMKELILDESTVIELFRKNLDDLDHRDVVNMDIYSTYRIEVPVQSDDTAEKYFERLCERYEKSSQERKDDFRTELIAKKIDLEKLIKGNSDLIKNNAQQLSEALIEFWYEYVSLNDKVLLQEILGKDASLDNIREMYQKLFLKLGIAKRIAGKIRRYVDGQNKSDLPYEIVADISAELLNKCINTVGFEYLEKSVIKDLHHANQYNMLGLILENNTNPTESSVEVLFNNIENQTEIMTSHPEEMKRLPNYRNYLTWKNRLKVGFVSICDIPNYDVIANAKLGVIIDECKSINY